MSLRTQVNLLPEGQAEAKTKLVDKRPPLVQEAENRLIDSLVVGYFTPGQKLQDEQLSQEFGVTHTPLREALRALAARGLLEHIPNRGYRVRVISLEEMVQLYQVREVLEGLAARLLAPHVTDEQIAELERLSDAIPYEGRTPESLRADWTFHTRIAEWSGNTFISELLSSLQVLARAILGSQARTNTPPPGPHTSHRFIIRALASRDPDQAEAAMRAHLQDAIERSLLSLRRNKSSVEQAQKVKTTAK